MPPATRSNSANNTPTKPTTRSTSATNTPTRAPENALVITPRKLPHCSKCGRPRAGHPRSGCPFIDDADDSSDVVEDEQDERRDVEEAVEALGSMDLGTPKVNKTHRGRRSLGGQSVKHVEFQMEDTKEAIRERRKKEKENEMAIEPSGSLASISTATSELLDMLEFDDGDENKEDVKGKVATRRLSRKMPGTMMTPFSSFVSTVPLEEGKAEELLPRPLGKTMSMQEREVFMDDLEALSAFNDRPKVYVLTDIDAMAIQGRTPRGLYTHLVDMGQDRKLMIVGNNSKDVDELYGKLKKNGSGFKTGLVVGAAGMFGGLAFA